MVSAPNGEAQVRPAPTDERTTLELATCSDCAEPGNVVGPPYRKTLPASTKAVALRPYSLGIPGMALCNSAVVAQYMLPPTLSMVVPGVRSRGPKPLGANPRTKLGPPKKLLSSGTC